MVRPATRTFATGILVRRMLKRAGGNDGHNSSKQNFRSLKPETPNRKSAKNKDVSGGPGGGIEPPTRGFFHPLRYQLSLTWPPAGRGGARYLDRPHRRAGQAMSQAKPLILGPQLARKTLFFTRLPASPRARRRPGRAARPSRPAGSATRGVPRLRLATLVPPSPLIRSSTGFI